MPPIKAFIKNLIPESWWKNTRHLHKWLYPQGVRRHDVGFWRAFLTFSKVIIKQSISARERLDYTDAAIWMIIRASNRLPRLGASSKEPETVAWLESQVQPGDVLYDIGANVGAYSLIAAARTRGQCTVYAFEPNPGNFFDLTQNIFANSYEHSIIPLYIALNDTTAVAVKGYAGIAESAGVTFSKEKRTLGVPSFTLDALIPALSMKSPTLIKLDVDGAEMNVIKGAQKTLATPKLRSILVEINEAITPPATILTLFNDCGLMLAEKHHRGGTTYNYIFTRSASSQPTSSQPVKIRS